MSDETKAPENVPYIVYESTQARNERHIKRLVVALIIAIIMIYGRGVDDLMKSVEYFNPKLHNATIQKLKQL